MLDRCVKWRTTSISDISGKANSLRTKPFGKLVLGTSLSGNFTPWRPGDESSNTVGSVMAHLLDGRLEVVNRILTHLFGYGNHQAALQFRIILAKVVATQDFIILQMLKQIFNITRA